MTAKQKHHSNGPLCWLRAARTKRKRMKNVTDLFFSRSWRENHKPTHLGFNTLTFLIPIHYKSTCRHWETNTKTTSRQKWLLCEWDSWIVLVPKEILICEVTVQQWSFASFGRENRPEPWHPSRKMPLGCCEQNRPTCDAQHHKRAGPNLRDHLQIPKLVSLFPSFGNAQHFLRPQIEILYKHKFRLGTDIGNTAKKKNK